MKSIDWWKYPSQLIKHFHLSPNDAWNCTLLEFINFSKCDDKKDGFNEGDAPESPEDLKEQMHAFLAIHKENREKKERMKNG